MKAGDTSTRDALRGIITALKNESIARTSTLTAEQEVDVLSRQAKRLREAIDEARKANRSDIVEKNNSELHIVMRFMPAQASNEEIEAKAKELMTTSGVTDHNKLMGLLMKEFKGKADGARVKEILGSLQQ